MQSTAKTTSSRLLEYFDGWTIRKGEDYFWRGKVLRQALRQDTELWGRISGSFQNTYESTVYFEDASRAKVVETDCSCPLRADCKHTVALLLAHLKQNNSTPNGAAGKSHSTAAPSMEVSKSSISTAANRANWRPAEPEEKPGYSVSMLHESAPLPKVMVMAPEVKNGLQQIARGLAANSQTIAPHQPGSYQATTALVYILPNKSWSGRATIELSSVSLRKDESFGATRPLRLEQLLESSPPRYALPEDIEIARLWQTISQRNYYSSYQSQAIDEYPEFLMVLLDRILASNRCHFDSVANPPLKRGPALPGRIGWAGSSDGQWRITVLAADGGKEHECLPWCHPWYVNRDTWQCGPIDLDIPGQAVKALFAMRALSNEEAKSISVTLVELGLVDRIPPPPVANPVSVRMIKAVPSLHVDTLNLLRPDGSTAGGNRTKAVILSTLYPRPSGTLLVDESGRHVYEKHDVTAEHELASRLTSLGFVEVSENHSGRAAGASRRFVPFDPHCWLDFDAEQVALLRADGWQVSAATELKLRPVELDDSDLQFEVGGEDSWWFSLALNIQLNGQKIPLLPLLVAAIRRLPASQSIASAIEQLNHNGKFLSVLPDGNVISLPFDRMRAILVSLQELLQKDLDLQNVKASVLHAAELLQNESLARARWTGADKVLRLVERLKRLKSIERIAPPKSFRAELRPYQLDGLAWLQFLAEQEFGGLLADDMGLGKTVELLAHICLEKESGRLKKPFLVVCPTSVLPNWISETAKFAPSLKVCSFHGQARFASLWNFEKSDLVVTTYPLVQRDIAELKRTDWHGIALDEAQAIKNASTKVAQAVRSLKAGYRFCLTGTPVENHLGELWSQFHFLLPGLLGDQSMFNTCIRNPIEKEGNLERKSVLASRIRPFLLRRTKDEVLKELPDKTIVVQQIELDAAQCDLYETVRLASSKQVRDEIAKKGFKHSQIMILDALLKLRQVCCDPRLVKLTAAAQARKSAKLEVLIDMLQQLTAEGRKILVFSQFTSMLALIAEELSKNDLKYLLLTGDTKDRATPVKQFQEGDVPIFLISLRAGGTGLNLTAADVVVHYDPWWNPAVEAQATDRAHRIGQTKKVFVYKLVAQGTIEQRMLELQERKRLLAESIYDREGNVSLSFSQTDLEDLLSPIDHICERSSSRSL